jgi:hypothetical protein
MAKETDGRGRATMNEADIEYLRNINTRPGPNAGRSIDPSKPGPDALAQSDAEPTQIERVALAICRVNHEDPDRRMPTSENPPDGRPVWTAYEREARAAITALTKSNAELVAGLVEVGDISEQVWQALCARADARAADEIKRLAEELQYQYACDKAQQQEIERLSIENDWLRTALRAAQTAPKALAADRSGPADYVPPGGAGNGA